MAFGDLEPEEPCLHGIGQVVERVLDQKWYWAKILGPGSSKDTVNLEYVDDHNVEEDVPLSEVRVSTVPGAQPHLRGTRSTSSSSTGSSSAKPATELGIGSAGDDGAQASASYADKTTLFVADAAGGLEHAAYVEQPSSAGGKAREVSTQTADEESQTYLFPKRTTLEPRKPSVVEAPPAVVIPIEDELEVVSGGISAMARVDASACTVDGGDDEAKPSVPASGLCAFPGCGKESTYRCARCGVSFYCGRAHQKQHWLVEGGHAGTCQASDWLARVTAAKLKAQLQLDSTAGGGGEGGSSQVKATPYVNTSEWPTFEPSSSKPGLPSFEGYLPLPDVLVENRALALMPQLPPLPGSSTWRPASDSTTPGGGATAAGEGGYVSDVEEEEAGRTPSAKRVALQSVAEHEVLDFQNQQHMSVDSRPPTPIAGGGSSPPPTGKKEVTWSPQATMRERGRKRRQRSNMETGVFDQFSLSDSDEPASTSTATHGGWAGGGAAASLSRRPISDENIVMLLEMGFGEEQSRAALQMYNDDVERACELLLSGGVTDLSFLCLSDNQGSQVYGPHQPDDQSRSSLLDDDMKTQAGDLDMLPLEEEELESVKYSSEASIRVGRRGECHHVTVDVYGFHHPHDVESQRPYALRFVFKDREGPQVLDVPGRDVVVGVNTYKKDRDLLLAENEEVLIRAILDEVSAVREGDHWAYSLMFPGRMVACSRPYVPQTSAA